MPDNTTPLSHQIAVITGGSRGIGAGIAECLAAMGARTIITGRDRSALEATRKRIEESGGECTSLECDVTNVSDVDRAAKDIESKFGRVDILVNNAGVGSFNSPLHELPPDEWHRVMNTNLSGVYYCMRAFTPIMIRQKSGHIVNISSIASKNALPKAAAYAASKWGLNGLSYSVAEELRGYNIRVTVVCPGSVDTELSPHAGKDPNKMLKPSDVAHVVAMLVTQAPQSFASEIVLRPTLKP